LTVDLTREHHDGMKLEHVKVGRDYMWGDRRVTVRAITDARRDGDPESEGDEDLIDNVTVAGVDDTGTLVWQHAPVSALRPLPVTGLLDDMRANYAHKFVPDPMHTEEWKAKHAAACEKVQRLLSDDPLNTPEGQQFAEDHLGVVVERPGAVYERWEDVPRGALLLDTAKDLTHKWSDGSWGWRWSDAPRRNPASDITIATEGYGPWTLIALVSDDIRGEQVTELVRGMR